MSKKFELTELRKVESSNISQVGFHDNSIFVEFKNGTTYEYLETSKEDYSNLVGAKSVGKHLNTEIKGNFDCNKVDYDLILPIKEITLLEKISQDIIIAMKNRVTVRSNTLKLLKSELLNNQKSKKPINDLKVLKSYHKKLKKSLDFFEGVVAQDLNAEISILEEYLPKEMSDTELVEFINTCFNVHLNYENLTSGEIIGKIKKASGSSNGKLIMSEVNKHVELRG